MAQGVADQQNDSRAGGQIGQPCARSTRPAVFPSRLLGQALVNLLKMYAGNIAAAELATGAVANKTVVGFGNGKRLLNRLLGIIEFTLGLTQQP